MRYSVIIPVYNRPDEVEELLESLLHAKTADFEVLVVEDGSSLPCEGVVRRFEQLLPVRYFVKPNSGPGTTRNYGAERARGRYLIFFDSDCIIPPEYFSHTDAELNGRPVDLFGGPDRSHPSFTPVQKAISYAMTSFFTTGGIRGGRRKLDSFHPRSFNMGISAEAFRKVGGFSSMRFGEDVDLSLRLIEAGYQARLFPKAFVYHKRRTDFRKFFKQVFNSGLARINLWRRHPGSLKPVHLLPALFVMGMLMLLIASVFFPVLLLFPLAYSVALFADSLLHRNGVRVALLSVPAAWVQLAAYGMGFIYAFWRVVLFGKKENGAFLNRFYS